ncbi:MAG TPA: TetR/AcrR family transcriptional regulator [Acidimicrobiales bacterium]|nr:TetR/AcrR family transcriptional regulator [Acidimicrobiales bacterium]
MPAAGIGRAMQPESDVLEPVDGRTARRDRNRTAVLDAVLALFAERNVIPSAEDVARRSGVSLRSVYRYVENTDELILAAVERRREQVAPLFEIERLGEGLEDRVDALCRSRVGAYDEVAPTSRAARARAYSVPILRHQLDEAGGLLRDQVAAQFAPELRALPPGTREGVLAAADALCQLETIELYRCQRGFTSEATATFLAVALLRLFVGAP